MDGIDALNFYDSRHSTLILDGVEVSGPFVIHDNLRGKITAHIIANGAIKEVVVTGDVIKVNDHLEWTLRAI